MAQSQTYTPSKGILYNKETVFGFKIHTNGWEVGLDLGKIRTYYKTKYYHFGIGELKNPKENRQSIEGQSISNGKSSRSYIYGKQNSFYVLRASYGVKRYFSEKAKRKGLVIGMSYEIGPTLGIQKPYYVELRTSVGENGPIVFISQKYTEESAMYFLNTNSVYGRSSFTKGFDEITPVPGGHAKFGLHFDWGAFDEFIKALEMGVMIDVFPTKIPIMVEQAGNDVENRPFFINLYLTLQLGKRQ